MNNSSLQVSKILKENLEKELASNNNDKLFMYKNQEALCQIILLEDYMNKEVKI